MRDSRLLRFSANILAPPLEEPLSLLLFRFPAKAVLDVIIEDEVRLLFREAVVSR
jgi:hypothetical protein